MERIKAAFATGSLLALLLAGCARERLGPPPPGAHKRASAAPLSYYLDDSAGDALELGVREAFQLWSDSTSFKFVYSGKATLKAARDGRNAVLLARRWPNELPIGDAAWCQLYLDGSGRIAEADILLNAQAFDFTTRREARPGALYVEDVLAREIGRSIGAGAGGGGAFRRAAAGDGFEPGIDPADMAAYLSLYATGD